MTNTAPAMPQKEENMPMTAVPTPQTTTESTQSLCSRMMSMSGTTRKQRNPGTSRRATTKPLSAAEKPPTSTA